MAWLTLRDSFFLFFRRLGIFMAANVLWIIFSLPLITMPAATGALYYVVDRVIAEELNLEPVSASIRDFWKGLRLYWLSSTLFMLVNLAILAILSITGIFYWRNPIEFMTWLIGPLALIFLGFMTMNIYLVTLRQVYRDDSVWNIFRRAARLVVIYPLDSFLLLIWLILIAIFFFVLAGPGLLLLFSFLAVNQGVMLRTIRIRRGEIAEPVIED